MLKLNFRFSLRVFLQVQCLWHILRYFQCGTVTYGSVRTHFFNCFNEKTEATTNYKLIITEFITNLLEHQHIFPNLMSKIFTKKIKKYIILKFPQRICTFFIYSSSYFTCDVHTFRQLSPQTEKYNFFYFWKINTKVSVCFKNVSFFKIFSVLPPVSRSPKMVLTITLFHRILYPFPNRHIILRVSFLSSC
jgi:hypothetical protein